LVTGEHISRIEYRIEDVDEPVNAIFGPMHSRPSYCGRLNLREGEKEQMTKTKVISVAN